jgi:NADH-quinone oxidoreductase subunit G
MPTIHVDGKAYEAPADKDLLSVLIDLGINLPYFCWHPAMGSVGACRQCAVKVYHGDSDQHGRIVMACMTPVSDGLRLSVKDPEVTAFRQRVIEWLMVNHPHDCPICDEGGECHLQDMTVMTGHAYRRYRGRKRTYRNQYLGPFVNHEMNRCIQCYRCLRFYRDYAGGRDFDVFASKDHTYFGRYEDGVLESEFSGNLVEVCPTGVFTDKTLKAHYTRKWDLETAPSICAHCGIGCNIIPGARYGMLRRIYPRFHLEINGYFICDRGRYGYEFANDPRRLRAPVSGKGQQQPVSWPEAMRQAQEALAACERVLGVGSPRASLEANYVLQALVGEDAFSPGISAAEHEGVSLAIDLHRRGPARSAALAEAESADTMLILGADPTNEAPMLDLAIRQGVHRARLDLVREAGIPEWNDYPVRNQLQDRRGRLFIAAVASMKLEAIAEETYYATPPELAALGASIAEAARKRSGDDQTLPGRVAQALLSAKQPLVVASVSGGPDLLRAAASIANSVSRARETACLLAITVPECNSIGVGMLGGRTLDDLFAEIESGRADGLIVLENDLFRRESPERVAEVLRSLRFLIAIDHLPTRTAAQADLALPATTFAETTGTLINNEGRAQRFYRVFVPEGEVRPSWQALRDLLQTQRPGTAAWASPEEALGALAEERPEFAPALEAAPPATWRDRVGQKIARESHRDSGRTAKDADRRVFEPQPPADPATPFAFSMEGYQAEPPAALYPRYWYPGWNSVQALYRSHFESGSPPYGGMPGRRLLAPSGGLAPAHEAPTPASPAPLATDEIWLAPRAVIFGSEELSRQAPAVASVMPPPTVRLNPVDAGKLAIADGASVRLHAQGQVFVVPANLDPGVAVGVAVVPIGYPETAGIFGISRARIEPVT